MRRKKRRSSKGKIRNKAHSNHVSKSFTRPDTVRYTDTIRSYKTVSPLNYYKPKPKRTVIYSTNSDSSQSVSNKKMSLSNTFNSEKKILCKHKRKQASLSMKRNVFAKIGRGGTISSQKKLIRKGC